MPGPFPYDPNIPQPNDQLSISQGDILLNFQGINNILNVNHVDFAQADAGKHKWVSMPSQGADPATLATEIALYSKTIGGNIDLFFRKQNNGDIYNMTGSNRATAGSTSATSAGYTRLPSGILIKWGRGTVTGFQNFTFPANDNGGQPIPAFVTIFGGTISVLGPYQNLSLNGWGAPLPANTIQLAAPAVLTGFTYVFFGKE